MYEVRCPSCRLRLYLYQGMGRDVAPLKECPQCHLSHPVDDAGAIAVRLAARIDRDQRADSPYKPLVGRDSGR